METHTHKSPLVTQRGTVGGRRDLQGPPVLPAVGWLEGPAVFVKVMGPRWANSQGTRSMLCHLRSTPVERGLAGGGAGTGAEFWGEGFQLSSSPHNPLSLAPAPPAPPESDYQASREQTSPIWSVYSGAEAGAWGALLHLFGEKRPVQTQLMKS